MTVHSAELLQEITPLLQHVDKHPGQWIPFTHENDRDFAAAARWLAHHPQSPLADMVKGRTLAIQWKTPDGEWTVNRTTTTPVRNAAGARIGRIRFRTRRTTTGTTTASRTRKAR